MTDRELDDFHLAASFRLNTDSPEIDAALLQAGLDPGNPSGYSWEEAWKAVVNYVGLPAPQPTWLTP